MVHKKLDSVQQIATGTGTGALTLGAASSAKFRTLQAAGMGNSDTAYCRIQHSTIDAEWEISLVTYSGGTISRAFDGRSVSPTSALISFSAGDKIVSVIPLARDTYEGEFVNKNSNFTVADSEAWFRCNNTGFTTTVTLPDPALWPNRVLHFKTITPQLVQSASANVIPQEGVVPTTGILPAIDGAWCTLVSDGVDWHVFQEGATT